MFCSVVVRAWAERGAGRAGVRARVLVIDGTGANLQEVGVAAGEEAVARLVIEGIVDALGLGAPEDY